MPNIKIHKSNFNGGLLSSGFAGRSDLAAFRNGAQILTNWANLVPGGIRRRPGTRHRYSFGSVPTRIAAFDFNEAQRYIICFQASKFIVIDPSDWSVVTTVTSCPWTEDQLFEIRYTQRADVMVICHQSFHPQLIRRTSASTYSIENFPWETDPSGAPTFLPQYKIAGPSVTLLPSGSSGSVTLTTSVDHWVPAHVGVIVEYRESQISIVDYISPTQVEATILEPLDQAKRITTTNAGDFTVGETVYGKDSAARAEVVLQTATTIDVNQIAGTFEQGEEIEGLTSGVVGEISSVSAIINIAPLASADWTEQAFSAAQGYPRACVFHGGRLWFGGSTALPAHLFGSNAQAFFKFDVGEAFPADGINDLIAADNVHQIEHLHAGRQLQIFTDQGTFYAPESENRPITPEDFLLRRVSWYGCKQARPVQHEASTLIAQEDSPLIREVIWNELQQNFDQEAINYQAHTITNNTKEIVMADSISGEMEPYAMFLQTTGTIAVWTGVRRENLSAWANWETRENDEFYSLANTDGKIIAVTKRGINGVGSSQYFLESFEFDQEADGVVLSDSLSVAGSIFTGFGVYGTEPLSIMAPVGEPRYYLGDIAASGGAVNISSLTGATFTRIQAGFNFVATLKPMPVAEQLPDGALRGRRHRIVATTLDLNNSLDFELRNNVFRPKTSNSDPTQPPTLFTGYRRFYSFGWGQRQDITIISDKPLPVRILSITYEVAF